MTTHPQPVVFVSHTTADDAFVRDLRLRLERRGYTVLEDSTTIRPADDLPAAVQAAIDRAAHVVAVVSADAVRSDWVKCELRYARKIAGERDGFRVIPLQLSGASTRELRAVLELAEPEPGADLEELPHELLAIRVAAGAGQLDALLPRLLDALEGRIASGQIHLAEPPRAISELADLVLRLRHPRFEIIRDERGAELRRPVAEATLAFYPPGAAEPAAESPEFTLAAPLGKIEADDLRFYLERFHLTPFGVFAQRARRIADRLPGWGQDLWDALRPDEDDQAAVLRAWKKLAATAQRRFTVQAPPPARLPRQAGPAEQKDHAERSEAATELLALPWELLRDRLGYLFHDGLGVRVRRSLPGGEEPADLPDAMRAAPLRVLIVCARPENDDVDYIDHRVSVRPVTEALNALGELAAYEILTPPTFPALRDRLREALGGGKPYHIVHFDGHGVYDKRHGLGGLVFEHPDSVTKDRLQRREPEIVTADRLGAELRNAGVGLFFLEACQSARSEERPEASVAGRLLQSGIASVAAMSHSVLVETARCFTEVFYPALVRGERVGAAMLAGQRHLYDRRQRGWAWQPRGDRSGTVERCPLELQDWFVPVLYQDGEDPVLLTASPPPARVRQELETDRTLALGGLPAPPPHTFVGRSRELLAAERLLVELRQPYVVLRGEGGEGKTALAVELARWLVGTRRLRQAAFASVENLPDPRAVLWVWGGQLVPDFARRAGDSLDSAEQLMVRALDEQDTVLVLDNLESILPVPSAVRGSPDGVVPGSPDGVVRGSPDPAQDSTDRSPDSGRPAVGGFGEVGRPAPNMPNVQPAPSDDLAAGRVFEAGVFEAVLGLCRRLVDRAPGTRIVFTSREPLPAGCGFDGRRNQLEVGRLSVREGIELVAQVLALAGGGRETINAEAVQAEREDEIRALVETVSGHARSLVLLTPELARRGLAATTEELAQIMADLEQRYPGQRQRSLFASVELSLRRLPSEVRKRLAPLGVVQGGASLLSLTVLLEVSGQDVMAIGSILNQVGLAELSAVVEDPKRPSDIFLRFDPALAPALRRELRAGDGTVEAAARRRWAESYRQLAGFLCQQQFQDAHLAAHLTILELPNLLAALRLYAAVMEATHVDASLRDANPASERADIVDASLRDAIPLAERAAYDDATPETVIEFATDLESLLQNLGRREALAAASAVRERARHIHEQTGGGAWSKSAYLAADQQIDRLIDTGRFREAVAAARSLAAKCEAAGDEAYQGADYDRAMAQFTLGRALRMNGEPRAALQPLATARTRLESLAKTMEHEDHRKAAAGMASACLTDEADCLRDLGQLDAAAAKYQEAIRRAEGLDDRRQVAINKSQLGTVRLQQQRYGEALKLYHECRVLKESLGESLAVEWHQIGIVHEKAGNLDEAEAAYQKSLAMEVQAGNRPGEAASRNQLGSLYSRMEGRHEEAVQFFRQAAEIYADPAIDDRFHEGVARNNAADELIALGRLDEAREELARALECKRGLGPNAEMWKTWNILHNLETAAGNPAAAAQARRQAMAEYENARRQGWQIAQGPGMELCQTVATIVIAHDPATPPQQIPAELRTHLPQIEAGLRQQLEQAVGHPRVPANLRALAAKLLAILDGTRDPALADDPVLYYADAVELKLLLEQLA